MLDELGYVADPTPFLATATWFAPLAGRLPCRSGPAAGSGRSSTRAGCCPRPDEDHILYEVTDGVAVITLNRPERANALSSRHDLKSGMAPPEITLEWIYELEARKYLEYSLPWRNVPKPSIAAVQGKCIAGGLLLAWPSDLIVAAENAEFSDPVVFLGIGGVEYHGHTRELGPRKAKEILFTRARGDRAGGGADRHGESGG